MSTASSSSCWAKVVFPVLKYTFFLIEKAKYFSFCYSDFFLEISTISHEKVKKTNRLNAESFFAELSAKKAKNINHTTRRSLLYVIRVKERGNEMNPKLSSHRARACLVPIFENCS